MTNKSRNDRPCFDPGASDKVGAMLARQPVVGLSHRKPDRDWILWGVSVSKADETSALRDFVNRLRFDQRWLPILLCFAFCVLFSLGCQSTDKPASASFASVVISGNTPGQIRDAAIEVFSNNGYKVAETDPARLVFEKEASRMNNFAYGSWLGDAPVWVRVKAAVVSAGEMTFRLQCQAYMVRDRGGATEEEVTLSSLRKGPYQKLLEEIATRFKFNRP